MEITEAAVDGATEPEIERQWLNAVHEAARTSVPPGRVGKVVSRPGPGWNFYWITVEFGDMRIRLLLNAASSAVAAAEGQSETSVGPLTFVDVPNADAFRNHGFTTLTTTDLVAGFTTADLRGLSEHQVADVEYHRPERVGDLIFNRFD